MTPPLPPLEAYRRDADRLAEHGSDVVAGWLVLAQLLWRTPGPRSAQRAEWPACLMALAAELRTGAAEATASADAWERLGRVAELAAVGGDEPIAEEVVSVAADMEEAGALAMAASTLAALLSVAPGISPLARGRVVAQRARVARKLGDFEAAADLYGEVARLGARAREPELLARADLGRGILARIRGNYPDARRYFRRVLARARRAALPELVRHAHEGLMVAAATARDFDTALVHGWEAFALVQGNPTAEADVLGNLATVCCLCGQDRAALAGYLHAAELAAAPRVRLPALANAAVCAARLGQGEQLAWCTARVEEGLHSNALPYETAQLLLALAEAWVAAGVSDRTSGYLNRGLQLAHQHGFHEIVHAMEALQREMAQRQPAEQPLLNTGARVVIRALQALNQRARGNATVSSRSGS